MATAKEIYKRLLFKKQMQKKVKAAEKKIDVARNALDALRKSCPHYDSTYVPRGGGGGWDDDDKHYWYEIDCHDCGLRTSTPSQAYGILEKNFPYAVKKDK